MGGAGGPCTEADTGRAIRHGLVVLLSADKTGQWCTNARLIGGGTVGALATRGVSPQLAGSSAAISLARTGTTRASLSTVTGRLSPDECSVLEALEDVATPFELVCGRSGLGLALTAVALERLATLGLAARSGSGWERSADKWR